MRTPQISRIYFRVLTQSERIHHSRTLPPWAKTAYKPIGRVFCGLYDLYLGCPLGQAFFPKSYKRLPKILNRLWNYTTIKPHEWEPVELSPPRKRTRNE